MVAGVDSFYEYLIKAYILFGSDEYWDMFHSAYLAVQKYFRHGPWLTILPTLHLTHLVSLWIMLVLEQ